MTTSQLLSGEPEDRVLTDPVVPTGIRMVVVLTDEEVAVLDRHTHWRLPTSSLGRYAEGEQRDAAAHAAHRGLVARGLCDEAGAPQGEMAAVAERMRHPVARFVRALADRTDELLVTRERDGVWLADLVSDEGFHQFIDGPADDFADFVAEWAVPFGCTFSHTPDVTLTRDELAKEPEVMDVMGEVAASVAFTNSAGNHEVSLYAGTDHAMLATAVDESLVFRSVDPAGLRAIIAESFGVATQDSDPKNPMASDQP